MKKLMLMGLLVCAVAQADDNYKNPVYMADVMAFEAAVAQCKEHNNCDKVMMAYSAFKQTLESALYVCWGLNYEAQSKKNELAQTLYSRYCVDKAGVSD
jgi:hypothetical protein